MLDTTIIVFREVLEASLIVSIVMAACKGIGQRNFWVSCGVFAGVLGAGLVAAFAASLAALASGVGQELFNASILFLAVATLGWHNVWMSRHGRELASQVGAIGQAVIAGTRPLYAVAIVTGIAVLREGSETVLFVYGIAESGGEATRSMLAGGVLGLAGGIAVGTALYFGLLRLPLRRLFTVTNGLILFLAAGMASQGADFLVQADLLPPLGDALWDTSGVLSEHSIPGKALHTLIGYVSQPAGIQLLFYIGTLALIGALMRIFGASRHSDTPLVRTIAIGVIVSFGALSQASTVHAELKLRYPIVDYRELEFRTQRGHDLRHAQQR